MSAAGLSFAAALIHASVTADHFREYWLFGLLFVVVAVAQLGWAEGVRRHPADRRLLGLGAAGNLAVAGVWAVSRSVGLPFGPGAGLPEGIGLQDALATLDELVIAAIAVTLLTRAGEKGGAAWMRACAWALAAASLLAALVGGH